MTTRTTFRTVVFAKSFHLPGIAERQPPGAYTIEIDEELIESMAFQGYRHTSSRITLGPNPERPGVTETIALDPDTTRALLAAGRDK